MQSRLQCTQLHYKLQSLTSLVTLSTLQVSQSVLYLESRLERGSLIDDKSDNAESYLANQHTLHLISTSLIGAASLGLTTAGPAIFAWGILIHSLKNLSLAQRAEHSRLISDRDAANSSEENLWMEVMVDMIQDVGDEQEVDSFLMSTAVDRLEVYNLLVAIVVEALSGNVSLSDMTTQLHVRLAVLKLIRMGLSVTKYSHEVLVALLAALAGNQNSWLLGPNLYEVDKIVIESLLDDKDVLFPHIFQQAQMRFPFETVPFIRLCNALKVAFNWNTRRSEMIEYLQRMPRFTQRLPLHYRYFEPAREDELPNCIRLTQDLPIFSIRKDKRLMLHNGLSDSSAGSLMKIPIGTIGYIISDSKPAITSWDLQYSMLQFLTVSLTTLLSTSGFVDCSKHTPIEYDAAAETIILLSNLIDINKPTDRKQQEDIKELMEEISNDLGSERDVIDIICDIFEQELHRQCDLSAEDRSLDLLVNCIHFIRSFVSYCPCRIWAFLRRSVLIDIEDGSGAMISIISSFEMMLGEYEFLRACLQLFEKLVDDVVLNSVARKVAKIKNKQVRFKSSAFQTETLNDIGVASILKSWGIIFIDILKSLPGWKFNNENERFYIATRIAILFQTVLHRSFAVDDNEILSEKLTYHLADLADFLAQSLLSDMGGNVVSHPILQIFSDSILLTNTSSILRARTEAMLCLADTLVKIELYLNQSPSYLRSGLLDSVSSLIYLFSASVSYELLILKLLRNMVRCEYASSDQDGAKSSSLLRHMGPQLAAHFVLLLTQKLASWTVKENERAEIWKFFASIVADRQQWFTVLLLQGHAYSQQSSRNGFSGTRKTSAKPVFAFAMDQLADIERSNPSLQVALLELVLSVQRSWPAVNREIHRHPRLLTSLLEYLSSLVQHEQNMINLPKYYRLYLAALIVEIFAFHVQNLRIYGSFHFLRLLIPKLSALRVYSLAKLEYNHSLHMNLAKNIEQRFPGCTLLNFKNTIINEEPFGDLYFYDQRFAATILNFDTSWKGQTHDRGFSNELTLANINLSLVEAQMKLLQSWGLLMLELSAHVGQGEVSHDIFMKSIEYALKDNAMPYDLPPRMFTRQSRGRLDHSFILLQRLVAANASGTHLKDVMLIIWNLIKTHNFDFECPFEGEDASQYRKLLKLLYLSLNLLSSLTIESLPASGEVREEAKSTDVKFEISNMASDLNEIITDVVAKGFRSLANQVHVDAKSCTPADIALLTAILQALLKLPGASFLHSHLALQISNFAIPRYAMSLYSWSDELLVGGDPIFGELSIRFLFELSSVPIIAESLAVEGVLSQISAANITNFYRRPNGMSPFDEPQRLFFIWARAILPLCLNLLEAVGSPIASEVLIFLNQFPNQLSRATNNLKTRAGNSDPETRYITLGVASEIYTLSLINHALGQAISGAWASGTYLNDEHTLAWDKAGTKEDLESLLKGRGSLKDRIIPHYEHDAELARSPPSVAESDFANLLEERVVETLELAMTCLEEV